MLQNSLLVIAWPSEGVNGRGASEVSEWEKRTAGTERSSSSKIIWCLVYSIFATIFFSRQIKKIEMEYDFLAFAFFGSCYRSFLKYHYDNPIKRNDSNDKIVTTQLT